LGSLGLLALKQRQYAEAQARYTEALVVDRALGEPSNEAITLHQLGRVAEEQKNWGEAERYYRESLSIKEQLGNVAGAAMTCNQLAFVTKNLGRSAEAEGWYKRALELDDLVQAGSFVNANHLSNLAGLLLDEVNAGRISSIRLANARGYAKQALAIKEKLGPSSSIWITLGILADIADLEGHIEEARNYHRRERESFAAFEGNRYHIDRQHGRLIATSAAAAKGDMQAQQAVEEVLPELEENDWQISDAIHRIWAGERDWHSLAEGIDANSALLILRILETIAQSEEAQNITPAQVFTSLPVAIREAFERGDQTAFEEAFAALSQEEQQAVLAALQFLQNQQSEGDEDDEDVNESGE
jgi:tetratricopeptide (TPR) repeat protein